MSTTIDQRVVEMRFDNRHFEKNTRETMSTLDRLKQKLNLSGAAKGLENINTSANKVNMNGLSNALTTVQSKFSAMEVVGVTALANITNSAVNAGKRIVSALTIDPVKTGLQEYETQINAIQTILANTQKEGTDVKQVNEALDELNLYADKTIYNFTEMTKNIGTFTAAGVKLDTSVKAIKGIANLAAVSGSTSLQASTAMYQLSQALAAGKVQLMDWNSVVNAGMGGQVFQDALIRTSERLKTGAKEAIKANGSFRESLTKTGWLTTEVLTETLNQLAGAYTKADLLAQGYSEEQANEITKLAQTAEDAATKVKTFTQLWDVMKEAAQSGWAQTWRLIIGDFEEAKALFTPLADFFTGIIGAVSDARNKLIEGALGKSFKNLFDSLAITKTSDALNSVIKSLDYYQTMVNKIWRGDYKNQPYRKGLLEKEGHDFTVLQVLVNKGYQYKLTMDDVTKAEKKYGKAAKQSTEVTAEQSELTADYILQLSKLSDAELKAKGYTDEQIESLRELIRVAKRTGIPLKEFIENLDKINGRYLLINSFKNLGSSLVSVFKSIGEAWRNAFPPMSSDALFNIIADLHRFSTIVRGNVEKNADKLTRTLKGLFAILDMISMLVGGAFKIAFTILKTILGAFNLNILDFTAIVGDAIVALRDWIEKNNIITIGIKKAVEFIIKMAKAVARLAKELWKLPGVQKVVAKITESFKKLGNISLSNITSTLKKLGENIKKVFSNINKHFNGVPGDIISGLGNGLKDGISKIITFVIKLATTIIDKFCEILGIHSPSKVFFAIGGFIIAGLVAGLLSGGDGLGSAVSGVVDKITSFFTNTDWSTIFSKIFSAGMSIGLLLVAKNLSDTIKNFSMLAGGLGSMFDGIGDVTREFADNMKRITKSLSYTIKGFGKVLRGIAFKKTAEGVKQLAWSILIIAGAVYLLAQLDTAKLWSSVGAIAALSAILIGLSFAVNKISESSVTLSKDGLKISGLRSALFSIGAALLMMAFVVKIMGGMKPDQIKQGFIALTGAVIALVGLFAAYGALIKGKAAQNMDKVGIMLKKMAWALLLMAVAVKLISLLKWSDMAKGAAFIAGFTLFVWGLIAVTKGADKNIDKVGKMISKISLSLLLLAVTVKLISLLKWSDMAKGAVFMAGFLVFVGALVAITKIGKEQQIAKVGGMVLAISTALLIMVGVVKLISMMKWSALAKGAAGIILLGGIIAGLLYVVKLLGPEAPKLAATLLAMAVAIGILAAVAIVLSLIDIGGLAKGIVAVGMLGGIMALMIKATKGANEIKGTLIAMAIAIGVMAAAIVILSFIDPAKLFSATTAISIVMGMFALIMNQSKNVTGAWGSILAMVGVIAVLGTVLIILAKLPIQNTLGAAVALSVLMLLLAVSLSVVANLGPTMMKGVAAIALMTLIIAGLAAILVLMSKYNVNSAIESAIALSTLLLAMSAALVILSVVGLMGPAAFIGIGALATFIAGIGALLVGIGAIMQDPKLQQFLDTGIAMLIKLANGLGQAIGAFVNGIATQILDILPKIGESLSLFMTNLTPFIVGAKMIDTSVLEGVGILAAAIIALSVVNLIEGITSLLTFGSSFADLGTQLSAFMMNAMPFIMASKLVDPAIMQGIKALAEAILILTGTNLIESITSWLTGKNSLTEFGSQLGGLAICMKNFATNLGTFDESKVMTVTCACNTIKALAEVAKQIPNEGGLWGAIVGENSLAKFGEGLPDLGTHLNGFLINLGTFDESKVTTVDCAGKAIISLANAAKQIPNEGGLWAAIVGENSLAKFGEGLPDLGTHLNGFLTNLGTFDEKKVATVDCAGKAIKALAESAKQIPNEGGLWAKIVGDNSLAKFGENLPYLASNIASFVTNLGTFNEGQVTTVSSACDAIRSIVRLGEINIKDTGGSLNSFGKNMVKFAEKVKSFVKEIGEVGADGITSAVNKTKELIEMAKSLANTNIDSVKTLGDSLKKFAKEGVKGFVKEFSGDSPKSEAKKAIQAMIQSGIKGAEDKKDDVKKKFKSIAEAAVDALSSQDIKNKAKTAGKSLVQGFASGIDDNTYLATAKARAMANAAEQEARKTLRINSPSKVFRKIGSGVPEGFAQGISMLGSTVRDSVSGMSNTAISGTSKAISHIADIVNMDIDSQPTIRPVLDLSDVESGAGYLSSLFDKGPSIGVMSNLNAISSGVNAKIQNGENSEVISAINRLGKNLDGTRGNTYNVNGVTYDDGSNISDAVETIIRAAIRERRV